LRKKCPLPKGLVDIFINMKNLDKVLEKLLDNFILPKFEDIMNYEVSQHDENVFDVLFFMDGTEEDIEQDIVSECQNILRYYDLPNMKIRYRFTVDGESFYDY
jgi:hypothetical protein